MLHDLAPVELAPERIQTSGIRTARAVRKTLAPEIRAFGLVSADERRQAAITARVPGWLRAETLAAVGDRVRRGQVLASIESPEVLAATRELVAVRAITGGAGLGAGDLGAPVRQRLEILGLPRAAIDRVERTGEALSRVPVVAPIAGSVTSRDVLAGAWVERGAPILSVADLSTVWVLAEVYARDLPRVGVGARAEVRVEGGAAPPATGTVAFVYPTTDASTRTTRVRVELPNPDLAIRPGLFADVAISAAPSVGIVVPADAVIDTGDRQYVFVAKGGGRFEPRLVRLGPRAGDETIVMEGIAEGEEVVTSGNFLLDSESRLRAAVQGPMAGMSM
jgi:Cu(I)/Ag(I) efflux system membrane fusion protein